MLADGALNFKNKEGNETISLQNDYLVYETGTIRAKLNQKTLTIDEIDYFSNQAKSIDLMHGVQMGVMLKALRRKEVNSCLVPLTLQRNCDWTTM